MPRLAALTVSVVLFVVPAAHAAQVGTSSDGLFVGDTANVANDVTVALIDATTWEVKDALADLTPIGLGCSHFMGDTRTVRCTKGAGDPAVISSFTGGGGDDKLTVTGAIGSTQVQGDDGNDALQLGGGNDQAVLGGSGADILRGGDGADVLNGDAGADVLDGQGGADGLRGGADGDSLADTGSSGSDTVLYDLASEGVTVTIANGQADDGNGSDGPSGSRDNVGAGIDFLFGSPHGDTLTGSAAGEKIDGASGNDTISGGAGKDELVGSGGDDSINAQDGVADVVRCDSSAGSGSADEATVDADLDTSLEGCEDVDPPYEPGEGPAGGGGGTPGAPVSTAVTVKVPRGRPDSRGEGRFRYTHIDTFRRQLERLGVSYRLKATGVPFNRIDDQYRDTIEDGDIFSQPSPPRPGREITVDPARPCVRDADVPCRLYLEVRYYDQSEDLKGSSCPYSHRDPDSPRLTQLLVERTYQDAVEILRARRCRFRIVNYVESKSDTEERIQNASVSSVRRKGERVYFVNLIVRRPSRSDFTVSIAPRPYSDYEANQGRADDFERELDPGVDGRLTYSKRNPGVIHVVISENFSGRFIRNVLIELVKNPAGRPREASVLGSSRTDSAGAVTFTFPVDWTGELEVNVRVQAKRTTEDLVEDTMRGWVTIPVVERPGNKRLTTQSGRSFKFEGGRWKRVNEFVEAMKAFGAALRDMTDWSAAIDGACENALASDANSQRAVNSCWKNGIAVVKSSSGGTTLGSGRAETVDVLGYVARQDGLMEATIAASVVPSTKSVLGAAILTDAGSGLLAQGVPVLNLSRDAVMTSTGTSLVADGGSGLVGKVKGVSLIGDGASGLIHDAGSGFISENGGALISDGASGLLPIAGLIADGGSG